MNRPHSAIITSGRPLLEMRDMLDTIEKNFEWESFKLDSPKAYFGAQVKQPKDIKALEKGHYLKDLHREKKHIPGVGKYNIVRFANEVKP